MPDGHQAWVRVRDGIIRNAGYNLVPQKWIADSEHPEGGRLL